MGIGKIDLNGQVIYDFIGNLRELKASFFIIRYELPADLSHMTPPPFLLKEVKNLVLLMWESSFALLAPWDDGAKDRGRQN